MGTLPIILLVTFASSLLGLIGGFVVLARRGWGQAWSAVLLSFTAGSILSAAFFDLIPESIEHGDNTGRTLWYILLGILVFFIVERLLIWHHHAHVSDFDDKMKATHVQPSTRPLIVFGDALHNFLDGGVIAAAFLVDTRLGIITTLAVLAHELPQEIGDFTILVHSGLSRAKIITWNILGSLLSPLGAVVGYFAAERFENFEPALLAFGAGNFIYLALADLVPALQHHGKLRTSLIQITALVAGLLLIRQIGIWLPHEAV